MIIPTFPMKLKYPIYDQNVYLNNHHKKTLKDQYGRYQVQLENILVFTSKRLMHSVLVVDLLTAIAQ